MPSRKKPFSDVKLSPVLFDDFSEGNQPRRIDCHRCGVCVCPPYHQSLSSRPFVATKITFGACERRFWPNGPRTSGRRLNSTFHRSRTQQWCCAIESIPSGMTFNFSTTLGRRRLLLHFATSPDQPNTDAAEYHREIRGTADSAAG